MVGRTFFLGGLLLGAAAATPVAVESNVQLATRTTGFDGKVDTLASWAHEYFGKDTRSVATRDLDAHNVIDKLAGWTKDYYHTDDDEQAATKREVDTNDVVDTVASWTKEWVHTGEAPKARDAAQQGETVDESIDRFAGKVKDYFQQGGSLRARAASLDFGGIIHSILGFLENLDWNSIIKTINNLIAKIDLNPIIKGILSWVDSTFFGGSSKAPAPTAAAHATRAAGIDWASMIQTAISWAEKLL